jgi:hypothetical protein
VTGILLRRVGPFAVWVWAAAGIAGVIALRHLRGGASTSSSSSGGDSSSGDAGALTPGQFGTLSASGAGGGGDDQPLQPDAQTPVDGSLANGGIGSPVVFDPATGSYVTGDPGTGTISSPPPAPIGGKDVHGVAEVLPPVPFGGVKPPTLPTVKQPKSTRGQTTPKKTGSQAPTSTSRAHATTKKTTATSGRSQTHAPAVAAPVRSSTPSRVEAIPHDARPPAPAPAPKPVVKPAGGGGGRPARMV